MIDIKVDKTSGTPLYIQIRETIKTAIEDGSLTPGERLPTVASFTKSIGVTACTVRRALEDLTKERLTESCVGRGTFVCNTPGSTPKRFGLIEEKIVSASNRKESASYTQHQTTIESSQGLDHLLRLAKRPGLIQFSYGGIDKNLMKNGTLKKIFSDAAKTDQKIYQTGNPYGLPDLRVAIAKRFSTENITLSPEQVMITGGVQQAVFLFSHLAFKKQKRVICESPWFSGIVSAFKAFNHNVLFAGRDHDGPLIPDLESVPKHPSSIFYLCPVHNNPMGTNLSSDRRKFITDWAVKQDATIISDEIYRELYFGKSPSESFIDSVDTGHFAVTSSFSKTFMFGMRTGWIIADRKILHSLIPLKRANDMGCPSTSQGIALSLIRTGEYDRSLNILRNHYRKIRDEIISNLESIMPDAVSWTVPQGGLHMWVNLPEGYSSIALFLLAIDNGVSIIPAPLLDSAQGHYSSFRISYGIIKPEEIKPGIKALAKAIETLLSEPPDDDEFSGLQDLRI